MSKLLRLFGHRLLCCGGWLVAGGHLVVLLVFLVFLVLLGRFFVRLALLFLLFLLRHAETLDVDAQVVGVISLWIKLDLPFMSTDSDGLRFHNEFLVGLFLGAIVVLDDPIDAPAGAR